MKVTPETLNDVMEFDHVIYVDSDGNVTEPTFLWAPEVYVDLDDDGQMIGSDSHDGDDVLSMPVDWFFMQGYTGQYGSTSRSFIMHSSESIGGKMARDILSTPGYYVAVVVDGLLPEGVEDDDTNVGWAVAFKQDTLDSGSVATRLETK
jgi:hypothetical protein